MKASFAAAVLFSFGSCIAQASISRSVDLPVPSTQIQLTDAEYAWIPTRTDTRMIPGCTPNAEIPQDCTETIVLESEPVIRANISYVDGTFFDESGGKRWAFVDFRASDFPPDDVAALKAAYPRLRHPYSYAGRRFAAKNLLLKVQKVERAIQVVDVRKSHICRVLDTGESEPGCVENIIYKPAKTTMMEATVSLK